MWATVWMLDVNTSSLIGKEFSVSVLRVIDGDTFVGRPQRDRSFFNWLPFDWSPTQTFRLKSIDAPELDQRFGLEAMRKLEDLLFPSGSSLMQGIGKEVYCLASSRDHWGRLVVDVAVPATMKATTTATERSPSASLLNVQLAMVEAGLAWTMPLSKNFNENEWLKQLGEKMNDAKARAVGLWQDSEPVAPWKHRAAKRKSTSQSQQQSQTGGEFYEQSRSGHNKQKPTDSFARNRPVKKTTTTR